MNKPKILIYDLEVSPCIFWGWGTGTQYVGAQNLMEHGKIICISYSFMDEDKLHSLHWDNKQCDRKMIEQFVKIAETADFIVGHNGDNFDKKWINARAAYHELPTLHGVRTEDTYKMIKREFKLPSYKLSFVCPYFGLNQKLSTDSSLWQDVTFKKDKLALKDMVTYCENDVAILKQLYQRIFKYVKHKYNYSVSTNDPNCCPRCGSVEIRKRGFTYTATSKFQMHECMSCKYRFRDGINLNTQSKLLKR
jgi:hypothetical protein